jgi:hypothetical protein
VEPKAEGVVAGRVRTVAKWLGLVVAAGFVVEWVVKPMAGLLNGPLSGLLDRVLDEASREAPTVAQGANGTGAVFAVVFWFASYAMLVYSSLELKKSSGGLKLLREAIDRLGVSIEELKKSVATREAAEQFEKGFADYRLNYRLDLSLTVIAGALFLLLAGYLVIRVNAEAIANEFQLRLERSLSVVSAQEERELRSAFASIQTRADMRAIRERLGVIEKKSVHTPP